MSVPLSISQQFGASKQAVAKWVAAGMPETTVDEAVAWLRVNRPRLFSSLLDESLESAKPEDPGPRGAYARARALEQAAYAQALEETTAQSVLAHSKAAASASEMAEAVATWELKRGSVLEAEPTKTAWVRFFATLRSELDSMPIRIGEKLGGNAEPVLTEWVNRTLTRLERCQPFGDEEPEDTDDA